MAEKQIKEASEKYKIKKFYGDLTYDTSNMFYILQLIVVKATIKIRKDTTSENINEFKRRRKEAKNIRG
ncbi:MAG: hypothetical protein QXY47_02805 [Thermoplasmata archaeon]